jgi:hypothetical protein
VFFCRRQLLCQVYSRLYELVQELHRVLSGIEIYRQVSENKNDNRCRIGRVRIGRALVKKARCS